jgi:hypothetical protein
MRRLISSWSVVRQSVACGSWMSSGEGMIAAIAREALVMGGCRKVGSKSEQAPGENLFRIFYAASLPPLKK